MVNTYPLRGLHLVVTRPIGQAENLNSLIAQKDGIVIPFPVLQIIETENIQPLLALVDQLYEFDFAIFISPNAVTRAMNFLSHNSFPAHLKIATIGPSARRELERFGITQVIAPPHRFDSEAFLELSEFKEIAGKKIVIFRGDNGRDLLGSELIKRGAKLEYVECYRRIRPNTDPEILFKYWANAKLNGIIVTSSEGMRNLFEMIGEKGQRLLRATPIFVPHERIRKTGYDLGLSEIILTAQGDEGIVTDIIQWFNRYR